MTERARRNQRLKHVARAREAAEWLINDTAYRDGDRDAHDGARRQLHDFVSMLDAIENYEKGAK